MSSFCEEPLGWPDGVCTGSVSLCQSEQLKPECFYSLGVGDPLGPLCLLSFLFSVSFSVEISLLGKL